MVEDVVFEVVGRSKTEKVTKEGNREIVFKVSLKSTDGKMKLTISSGDSDLIQQYPLDSDVPVRIGASAQRTLSDSQVEKEVEKAAEASEEENSLG